MTPLQRYRRPGADVQAVQLTPETLADVKALLSNCGIASELHDGHLLLRGPLGQPMPWPIGAWLVFGDDTWSIYSDSVVSGWIKGEAA